MVTHISAYMLEGLLCLRCDSLGIGHAWQLDIGLYRSSVCVHGSLMYVLQHSAAIM